MSKNERSSSDQSIPTRLDENGQLWVLDEGEWRVFLPDGAQILEEQEAHSTLLCAALVSAGVVSPGPDRDPDRDLRRRLWRTKSVRETVLASIEASEGAGALTAVQAANARSFVGRHS